MGRPDVDESIDELSEARKPSRPGAPIDPRRVVRALMAGKKWLLIAAVVGTVVGLLLGKFAVQHTYEASASIRYEGLPGQPTIDVQRELPSLVSVTHSETILTQLRARMGLEASLDLMRRMVQVQSDAGNGLVTFTTTGGSPEEAAEMANALVEIFLDHHRQRRQVELETEDRSLGERLEAARRDLTGAREVYDQFRESNGITDLSAEQEQAIENAAELRSQADLAAAEVEALEARVAQLERELAATPRMEAVSSGTSASGRRLSALRQRLAEARGQGLSDDHPQVQSLARQVEALEQSGGGGSSTRMGVSSLHGQLESNLSEAQAELEATRQRQQSLTSLAAQASERTSRFSTIEGQAANLLARVNVADSLVTELGERRARIGDQLRDIQTGFRNVARAQPPESAVPSKKKYAVALGIPIAFIAAMLAMLLFRELRGLRVQTPAEVAYWGDGPVIGMSPWPRDKNALKELVGDMDDYAPTVAGTLLVVTPREEHYALAETIAGELDQDWVADTEYVDVPIAKLPPPPKVPALSTSDPSPDAEPSDETFIEDGAIAGEIYDGPTEVGLGIALYEGPTEISGYDPRISERPGAPEHDPRLRAAAWTRKPTGQQLRRAARLADRVLVMVVADTLMATELSAMKGRLGRESGVGYLLVNIAAHHEQLPDREGDVESFWIVEEA